MRIEPLRATKVVVLRNHQGEEIRITKFTKADGPNKQGRIGIEAPPGWRITSVKRQRHPDEAA